MGNLTGTAEYDQRVSGGQHDSGLGHLIRAMYIYDGAIFHDR